MVVKTPSLGFRVDGHVAVITLARGNEGASLDTPTVHALDEAVTAAEGRQEVRVLLLRSASRDFSCGMSLEQVGDGGPNSSLGRVLHNPRTPSQGVGHEKEPDLDGLEVYRRLLERLRRGRLPVVTVVTGAVRAGGMALLGASDLVLATPEARFQLSEAFFNLSPLLVSAHLAPGRISPAALRSMAITGATWDAERALHAGLIDEIVPRDRLERQTRAVLRGILRASPSALQASRAFIRDHLEPGVSSIAHEGVAQTRVTMQMEETRRAVKAMLDGELPEWSERLRVGGPLTESEALQPDGPAPVASGPGPRAIPPEAEVIPLHRGRSRPPEDARGPNGAGPVVVQLLEDGILEVRLASPEDQNALTPTMVEALSDALRTASLDARVRAVVLAGGVDWFCSGASPETLAGVIGGDLIVAELALAEAVVEVPVPVIAAADGHAVGGGLVLAAAADVVFLARERRYGAVFMNHGLTPGMGCTSLLPMLVGDYLAAEMMLGGATFTGKQLAARQTGVNGILPASEVRRAATRTARAIADKDRRTLTMLKEVLTRRKRDTLSRSRSVEDRMHRTLLTDPCFKDGHQRRLADGGALP